jgi:acetolactate synthase-1/2/3 large subunit
MGAQAAYRDRLVLCIAGDGSFQMNTQELATAVIEKLPVKVFVINNRFHGMVRQWQDLFYEGRYASSNLGNTPDFVKLAEAYGAAGVRIEKADEVDDGIRKALSIEGPVVIDVPVYQYENCYPMIPAGGCNHEMILADPPDMKKPQPSGAQGATKDKDTILTA